jgi:hypothetical protein
MARWSKISYHCTEVELMKPQRLPATVVTVLALFAFQFQDGFAQASQVRYSWSGTMLLSGSDDPWLLGELGKSFELEIAVSRDAADLSDLDVEFAAFATDDVRFLLGGQEVALVGNGLIDFTDDWSGLVDLLVFHGEFERLGHTIEIGSLAALPKESFQFSNDIEPPPFFPSTANVDRATCCGGTYASVVAADTAVIVVPEPSSAAIVIGSIIGLRRFRMIASLSPNSRVTESAFFGPR